MDKAKVVRITRIVASLLITLGVTLVAGLALRAPRFILPVSAGALLVNGLYYLRSRTEGVRGLAVGFALGLALVFFGAVTLVYILITPLSAYLTWFRLFAEGTQRGAISQIFVMVIGYFGAVFGGMIYRSGVFPPLVGLAFVELIIVSIIRQSPGPALLGILCLIASLIVLASGAHSPGNKRRAATSSILLFVFVLFAAIPFARLTATQGSRFVDTTVYPGLRQTVVSIFPEFPLLYGVAGYGYTLDEKQLGGTPVLSERAIFELEGSPGERLYLRTDVFDTYTGQSWKRSPTLMQKSQTLNRSFVQEDTPDEQELRVTVLTELYNKLPHTLSTLVVAPAPNVKLPEIQGDIDTGFTLDLPFAPGDTIYLDRGRREALLEEPELATYLNVPDRTRQELQDLASSIRQDAETPRDMLANINEYLMEGFEYTLNTEISAKTEDFASNFLFGRQEGYCVHFATSLVLLARMNNLPARYVTGFLSVMPTEFEEFLPDQYTGQAGELEPAITRVSGLSAHAWPEVWLPDTGWTIWEATPPMNPGEFVDPYFYERYSGDARTSRQLRAILGEPVGGDADAEADGRVPPGRIVLYVVLSLAGVGAVYMIARVMVAQVIGPHRDTRHTLEFLSKRLAATAQRYDVPPPTDTGWEAWSESVIRLVPNYRRTVRRGTRSILRTFFGRHNPDHAEIRLLRLLNRGLRSKLRENGRHAA